MLSARLFVLGQALRFYGQILLSCASAGGTTYISSIVLPRAVANLVVNNRHEFGVTLAWTTALTLVLSVGLACSQYLGESLALDWRRALTRRVRLPVPLASLLA